MKKIFSLTYLLLIGNAAISQSVAINNDGLQPDAKAMLDIKSSNKGLLLPRTSTSTRRGIISPAQGLLIFDTTANSLFHYTGSNWVQHIDSNNYLWKQNGPAIYYVPNGSRVGVNTIPANTLHLHDAGASQIRFQNAFTGGSSADGAVIGISSGGNMEFRTDEANRNINLSGNGLSTHLLINSTGVGIGGSIATPSALTISNISSGQKIILKNNNPFEGFGIGVQNNALQIHAADATSKIEIGYGRAPGNFTPVMELQGNGVVDIKGTVTRPVISGNADLIPAAFGRVRSNGLKVGAAGNWTVTKIDDGLFKLEFPAGDISMLNSIIMVTAISDDPGDYDLGLNVLTQWIGFDFHINIGNDHINIGAITCGTCVIYDIFNRERQIGRNAGFGFVVFKVQ